MTTWVVRTWLFKSSGTKKPTRFFLAIVFSCVCRFCMFLVAFYNLSRSCAFFLLLYTFFIVLYQQSCFIISNFFHAAVIVQYYHKHTMEVSECFELNIFIFQAHTNVYSGFRTAIFFETAITNDNKFQHIFSYKWHKNTHKLDLFCICL
jgi:hypothetical protein